MRKLWIVILIAVVSVDATAQWYDPNNPNPTQNDVWEAERNAQNHMQRSVEVSGWDSIHEQEKANRARRDADEMRMRMWENERHERARRAEEDDWQRKQGGDDVFAVPGASASMLLHINKKRAQRRQRNLCQGQNIQLQNAPVAVDPGKLNFYKGNERYPGEFGKFDVDAYRRACNLANYKPGVPVGIQKQVAQFREEWEIGLYMTNEPQPKDFYYPPDFVKAHAGWSSRQDGLKWSDMQKGDRKRYMDVAMKIWKEKKQSRNK